MTHRANCQPTELFRTPSVTITSCQCGLVHLKLGPFSLNLSEAAFAGLVQALNNALAKLSGLRQSAPSRAEATLVR